MATISIPTSTSISPPLLIDADQLEDLDRLIDRHIESLRQDRERLIEQLTNETIRSRLTSGTLREEDVQRRRASIREDVINVRQLNRERRSVNIYLRRGKEVHAQTFAEAARQPIDEIEVPLGFSLFLKIGEIECRVRLAESWRADLSIDVEPNNLQVAQELFGALRNWGTDVAAPQWQRWWLKSNSAFATVLVMWLFLGLVLLPLSNWGDAGKNYAMGEARKLLADGINASDQARALELLLSIESDYAPGRASKPLGIRYWTYFTLGAIFLSIGCLCPKISIGLWKGREKLKRRRWWVKTATVTLPGLVLTMIILPWILHWAGIAPPGQ